MRFRWITAILLALLSVSGCWDAVDIDRRAIILALGLEMAPNNKILVSAQIPQSSFFPFSPGQSSEMPYQTLTGIAKTGYGATLGLESKTWKRLFFMQLKTVLVNTALAEQGIKPYFEYLERNPQINPQSMVVLTETNCRDTLSVPLSSKDIPGMAIYNFLKSEAKANQVFPMQTWEFLKRIEIRPIDAYLPIISYNSDEQVYKFDGIGVFHRDRLTGKLSETESRMAGIVMKEAHNATFTVPVGKMGDISYQRLHWKREIAIIKTEPDFEFLINVSAKGYGSEITRDPTELSPRQIKEIERVTENYLKRNMAATVHRLQAMNSDIIGFGELIRANKPELWKRLNWDQEYPRADFRVKVKFTLERVGKYR